MKKKIVQYIGLIQDGGAETLVKDYALILNKSLFDVIIVTRWRGLNTANYKILEQSGIKMLTIYPNNSILMKVFNRIMGSWYIPYKLYKIIKKENVQILHIHLQHLHNIAPIGKKIKNVKLFYTCHTLPKLLFQGKRKNEGVAARKLIDSNDLQIIALHEDMRKEVNSLFNINNTIVIKNGINANKFKEIDLAKNEAKKRIGISENVYVIGHVGRFNKLKNHSFLVDIFDKVSKKKDNVFLLMIGAGSEQKNIESKLRSLGHTDDYKILSHRSDIPELMRAMDVFVFPSKFEGLGIVLIEAQFSGLRCVISDTVPIEAIVTNKVIRMDLSDSPDNWANAVLDKKLTGKSYGDLNDYDMNKEIKKLEKLYLGAEI